MSTTATEVPPVGPSLGMLMPKNMMGELQSKMEKRRSLILQEEAVAPVDASPSQVDTRQRSPADPKKNLFLGELNSLLKNRKTPDGESIKPKIGPKPKLPTPPTDSSKPELKPKTSPKPDQNCDILSNKPVSPNTSPTHSEGPEPKDGSSSTSTCNLQNQVPSAESKGSFFDELKKKFAAIPPIKFAERNKNKEEDVVDKNVANEEKENVLPVLSHDVAKHRLRVRPKKTHRLSYAEFRKSRLLIQATQLKEEESEGDQLRSAIETVTNEDVPNTVVLPELFKDDSIDKLDNVDGCASDLESPGYSSADASEDQSFRTPPESPSCNSDFGQNESSTSDFYSVSSAPLSPGDVDFPCMDDPSSNHELTFDPETTPPSSHLITFELEPTTSSSPLLTFDPEPTSSSPLLTFDPEPISSSSQELTFDPEPTSSSIPLLIFDPEPISSSSQELTFDPKPTSSSQELTFDPEPTSSSQELTFHPKPTSLSQELLTFDPEPTSSTQALTFDLEPTSSSTHERAFDPEPTSSSNREHTFASEPTSSNLELTLNKEPTSSSKTDFVKDIITSFNDCLTSEIENIPSNVEGENPQLPSIIESYPSDKVSAFEDKTVSSEILPGSKEKPNLDSCTSKSTSSQTVEMTFENDMFTSEEHFTSYDTDKVILNYSELEFSTSDESFSYKDHVFKTNSSLVWEEPFPPSTGHLHLDRIGRDEPCTSESDLEANRLESSVSPDSESIVRAPQKGIADFSVDLFSSSSPKSVDELPITPPIPPCRKNQFSSSSPKNVEEMPITAPIPPCRKARAAKLKLKHEIEVFEKKQLDSLINTDQETSTLTVAVGKVEEEAAGGSTAGVIAETQTSTLLKEDPVQEREGTNETSEVCCSNSDSVNSLSPELNRKTSNIHVHSGFITEEVEGYVVVDVTKDLQMEQ